MFRRTQFAAAAALILVLLSVQSVNAQGKSGDSNGNKYGVGKPDKVQDLPPGQLRKSLEALPPGLRKKSLEWLQRHDFPEQDVEALHINSQGDVYYADYGLVPKASPSGAAEGPVIAEALDAADLFTLHSKPGSANVLFLDFDGHTITGTAWNDGLAATLNAVRYSLSYDPDGGDPPPAATTFTEEERKRIHEIWFRISEDFAPYDIDVTTEEPVTFTNTTGHVLFTHDVDANGNPMPALGAGGVAYVGPFGASNYVSTYSPALVYYTNLSNNYPYHGDASINAEAGSHEFGHNLDLSHDGIPGDSYYDGHGSGWVRWGAIMGGSYRDSVTQWSQGEYPNANNPQDDLAIIESYLGYSDDDVGDILGDAAEIVVEFNGDILVSNPEIDPENLLTTNKGVIGNRDDVDWWFVDVGAGMLELTVTPSWHAFNTADYVSSEYRGNNLDVHIELYDLNMNLLASDDPDDDTYATVTYNAPAGRYYLRIDGVGNDVGDGYTDYASIGQYFIDGSVVPEVLDTTNPSPDRMTWANVPAASGSSAITMTATTATDASGFVEYFFTCVAGGVIGCVDSDWQASPSYTATGLLADTMYSWNVRARDSSGNTTTESTTESATTDQGPPLKPSGFVANPVSQSQINLSWDDNVDETGYSLERYPYDDKGWGIIATLAANATSYNDIGLDSGTTYYYRLSATSSGFQSEYATDNATTQGSGGDPIVVTQLVRVNNGNDDVEERVSDGNMLLNSSDLEIPDDAYSNGRGMQVVGMRFQNLDIPWGATVVGSHIEYHSEGVDNTAGTHLYHAHDTDDAPPFTSTAYNVSSRQPTSASVTWNVPSWPNLSVDHQTPDLSEVVQEVVDRDGWSAGNDLAFMVSGNGKRSAWAYEGYPAKAPLLRVEYRECSESIDFNHTWQIFSLPCLPQAHTLADIFPDLDTSELGTTWGVWRLDRTHYRFMLLQPSDRMEVGVGYFLYKQDQSYSLSVSGKENRSQIIPLITDPVRKRYTLIGHAERVDIPWKDVRIIDGEQELTLEEADPDLGGGLGRACAQEPAHASCVMSSSMNKWNGNAYLAYNGTTPLLEGSITRWDGLFVRAVKPGISLKIPEVPSAFASSAPSAKSTGPEQDRHRDGDSWFVRLVVASGDNMEDPGNALGQYIESSDGLDIHDLPENKPLGSSYLSLVFENEALANQEWGYTSDYRAVSKKPNGTWNFIVRASDDVSEATLRWEGPEDVLHKANLINEQTGEKVKVKSVNSYRFPITDGEARFRFEVK